MRTRVLSNRAVPPAASLHRYRNQIPSLSLSDGRGRAPVVSCVSTLRSVISALDTDDTEQADLRGGRSPWFAAAGHPARREIAENIKCDALIVGAGITGSLVAERLTRQGLDVVIIDREWPGG